MQNVQNPLEIQKFLRGEGSLGELKKAPYKLSISTGREGRLVGFKYNQIKSDLGLDICQEARGLILDRENNWDVVSFPFPKFFNAAENESSDIDWDSAVAYEKLDGTCCTMYHFDGTWNVQTLGTVDAGGPIQLDAKASAIHSEWDGRTFAELFWEAFERVYGDVGTTPLDPDRVYVFELCTPINQVVVQHDEFKLPLIGVRDLRTLQEFPVEDDGRFGFFDRPRAFEISEFGDAVEFCNEELEEGREGVVIRDKFFRRIKLKTESYRKRHHMKSGVIERKNGVVELVQKDLQDDFVGAFPGFEEIVEQVENELVRLEEKLKSDYSACGGPSTDPSDDEERKKFALNVQQWVDSRLQGLMFAKLTGDADTFMDAIKDMNTDTLAEFVEVDAE